MKKLILATASVLALGLATSGASFAQQTGNTAQPPETNTPSASMPATGQSSPPTAEMQQRMNSTAPEHLSQNQLRQVQEQLKTAGLYKGQVDGQMGPETRQAVMQFQKKNGLQQTGRLDQQTLAALGNTSANGTVGEGSSAMPGHQPANAGEYNNGSSNPDLQPGMNGTQPNANQPGASGNLNPTTNHQQ